MRPDAKGPPLFYPVCPQELRVSRAVRCIISGTHYSCTCHAARCQKETPLFYPVCQQELRVSRAVEMPHFKHSLKLHMSCGQMPKEPLCFTLCVNRNCASAERKKSHISSTHNQQHMSCGQMPKDPPLFYPVCPQELRDRRAVW
jgi:hypothetical protein